jgi:hypothetical protein
MASQRERIQEVMRCQAYIDAASSTILSSRWLRCGNSATQVLVLPGMQPRLPSDHHYRTEPITWDYIEPIDPCKLPLMLLEELIVAEGQYQDRIREQLCQLERQLRDARIRQQDASDALIHRIRGT